MAGLNISTHIMLEDRLVEILGTKFECVDEGFGRNPPDELQRQPDDFFQNLHLHIQTLFQESLPNGLPVIISLDFKKRGIASVNFF